jgi:hypothetical protein
MLHSDVWVVFDSVLLIQWSMGPSKKNLSVTLGHCSNSPHNSGASM